MSVQEAVVAKVLLEGELTLLSPLLIGSGVEDRENDRDIVILRDKDGTPYIPGTSLAGALREIMVGSCPEMVPWLLGDLDAMQSSLDFADVKLRDAHTVFRDGVAIDDYLGAAIPGAKYDFEAVERGATGHLRLEATLRGCHTAESDESTKAPLRQDVLAALKFLAAKMSEGFNLGAMTAKGLGSVRLEKGVLGLFDFKKKEAVRSWLSAVMPQAKDAPVKLKYDELKSDLHTPKTFYFRGEFSLASSLIIRRYGVESDGKAVATMLKSGDAAVIPGTTLKGVLRHRAAYIMENLGRDPEELNSLMGSSRADNAGSKSRLQVTETYIDLSQGILREKEHTRNRIDRFTGGTIDSALFTVHPLWQCREGTAFNLAFSIAEATPSEVGLALFLIKDLCQGKISLGGEQSIGRGILRGGKATLNYAGEEFVLSEAGQVTKGDKHKLAEYAAAFGKGV
ncbi:MAG: hypothetical protein IJ849_01695 [Selenomonadaceae bacterium]|nr:hypothetical protein [Selenomonadaceae bacterium]